MRSHLSLGLSLTLGLVLLLAAGCSGTPKSTSTTGPSGPTNVRTWHVPADRPTIVDAMNAASSGDTIVVSPGTYHEHDIQVKSGVTLRSVSGQFDGATIAADTLGRVLTFLGNISPQPQIIGFTLSGGRAVSGGGIWCDESSPVISNCLITGNTDYGPTAGAGGIYCYRSNPALTGCTLSGNSALISGGAIGCFDAAPALINCTISGNHAPQGGGIACYSNSSLSAAGCTISGNTATAGRNGGLGAGVYCQGSAPAFTDCTISADTATVAGGGFYLDTSAPVLIRCTVSDNLSGPQGGAGIACLNSTPNCNGCTISTNAAAFSIGGGLLCIGSAAHLANCTFTANTALRGGAAACSLGSSAGFDTCAFNQNVASGHGGGIYVHGSAPSLNGCTLTANHAGGSGGGVAALLSDPSLTACTLSANTATLHGGGLYSRAAVLALNGCSFQSNSADSSGGGVAADSASSGAIRRCTFVDNSALARGGAVDLLQYSDSLSYDTFAGNTAPDGGILGLAPLSIPIVRQCILAFAAAGGAVSAGADSAAFTCCDLFGNTGGDWTGKFASQLGTNGNISADPLFCDRTTGILSVPATSKCSHDSSACGLIGAWPDSCPPVSLFAGLLARRGNPEAPRVLRRPANRGAPWSAFRARPSLARPAPFGARTAPASGRPAIRLPDAAPVTKAASGSAPVAPAHTP